VASTDKTERITELSQFSTVNKSLDITHAAVSSKDAFAGMPKNTAVEPAGIDGLTNGKLVGQHAPVSSLWTDMAGLQLSNSDLLAFPGASMSLYSPLMVNYTRLSLVLM